MSGQIAVSLADSSGSCLQTGIYSKPFCLTPKYLNSLMLHADKFSQQVANCVSLPMSALRTVADMLNASYTWCNICHHQSRSAGSKYVMCMLCGDLHCRYLDRIIRSSELHDFSEMLQLHQKALTADGLSACLSDSVCLSVCLFINSLITGQLIMNVYQPQRHWHQVILYMVGKLHGCQTGRLSEQVFAVVT